MRSHKKKTLILEQLDLFRPRPARPKWETLPTEVKKQATILLAQLIVEIVSGKPSSDQRELVDE